MKMFDEKFSKLATSNEKTQILFESPSKANVKTNSDQELISSLVSRVEKLESNSGNKSRESEMVKELEKGFSSRIKEVSDNFAGKLDANEKLIADLENQLNVLSTETNKQFIAMDEVRQSIKVLEKTKEENKNSIGNLIEEYEQYKKLQSNVGNTVQARLNNLDNSNLKIVNESEELVRKIGDIRSEVITCNKKHEELQIKLNDYASLKSFENFKQETSEVQQGLQKDFKQNSNSINQKISQLDSTIRENENKMIKKVEFLESEINSFSANSIKTEQNFNSICNTLSRNIQNLEATASIIPNISNDVEQIQKNIEDLTENNDNLVQNYNDAVEKNKKLQKQLNDIQEELSKQRNLQKEQEDKIKQVNKGFDDKYIKLSEEIMNLNILNKKLEDNYKELKPQITNTVNEAIKNSKNNDKHINEEFKQEIINRLLEDEKKFNELLEKTKDYDKVLENLTLKLENNSQSRQSGLVKGVIQKKKMVDSWEEEEEEEQNTDKNKKEESKKVNKIEEEEVRVHSKANDIEENQNINPARNSEKYKLNNEYLSCSAYEYVNNKEHFKGYLPKTNFTKKDQVEVIEASIELEGKNIHEEEENENEKSASPKKNENDGELYAIDGNASLFRESEDFDSKQGLESDPNDILISEEDFKQQDQTNKNFFAKKDKKVDDFFN